MISMSRQVYAIFACLCVVSVACMNTDTGGIGGGQPVILSDGGFACPSICEEPTDPCVHVTCDADGGCGTAPSIDGLECHTDAGSGYCDKGSCVLCTGCDDGNPCTFDTCGKDGACLHYPLDHNQSCTTQDSKPGFCALDLPSSGESTCCAGCGMDVGGGKRICVPSCPLVPGGDGGMVQQVCHPLHGECYTP